MTHAFVCLDGVAAFSEIDYGFRSEGVSDCGRRGVGLQLLGHFKFQVPCFPESLQTETDFSVTNTFSNHAESGWGTAQSAHQTNGHRHLTRQVYIMLINTVYHFSTLMRTDLNARVQSKSKAGRAKVISDIIYIGHNITVLPLLFRPRPPLLFYPPRKNPCLQRHRCLRLAPAR